MVALMSALPERIFMSTDGLRQALNDSQQYLNVVHKPTLSKSEAEWLVETTVSNFARYYNSGFIEYRKSVAEAGDFAAVEWMGRGATFREVLGRESIDCLGGFGLFNLGWAHPKVVRAVQAQLEKSPLPTQELLDPLRGMLAHLLPEITPGDIQYSFFVSSGTEAVEGAMKLAKLYTHKSGFIASVRGFHISGTLNNSRVIRVEPPLVITREEIDTVLNRLENTLQELHATLSTPTVPANPKNVVA